MEIGHVCLLCVFCSLLSTLGEGPKRNGITGKDAWVDRVQGQFIDSPIDHEHASVLYGSIEGPGGLTFGPSISPCIQVWPTIRSNLESNSRP